MIKAIDTYYSNHKFRSRLEARWAVYFDELATSWGYEQEGFELGNGVRYLPDFYLPRYKIYVEVKPKPFLFYEHNKCKRLANFTRKIVVEVVGVPNVRPCNIIVPYTYYVCPDCGRKENFLIGEDISHCGCNKKVKSINAVMENEAILLLHSPKESFKPLYYTTYMDDYTNDKVIQRAIRKATEARFEFLNT